MIYKPGTEVNDENGLRYEIVKLIALSSEGKIYLLKSKEGDSNHKKVLSDQKFVPTSLLDILATRQEKARITVKKHTIFNRLKKQVNRAVNNWREVREDAKEDTSKATKE